MKKLGFLALAIAGMLFAACSSDKDVAGGPNPNPNLENENQFLAFNINLPSVPTSMRAADNTATLDDGLPGEYSVKNAILLVFSNEADEDDAEFKSAYEISTQPWAKDDDPQVTTVSKKVIQEVSGVVPNDLMLVILNNNGLVEVDGAAVKINGSATAFAGTYEDFRKETATAAGLGASEMTSNGFYMANAVLANEAGSTKNGTDYYKGEAIDDYGLLYILNNSYVNGKSIYDSANPNKYVESWATQVAIWLYLYEADPSSVHYLKPEYVEGYKTMDRIDYCSDITDPTSCESAAIPGIGNKIDELVAAAKNASNAKKLDVNISSDKIVKTKDEKYYQSDKISVVGNPSSSLKNFTVALSGVDGAIAVDSNGNKLTGEVAPGTDFYVIVPVDKVTEKVSKVKVSVTGTFDSLAGNVYSTTEVSAGGKPYQKVVSVTGTTVNENKGIEIEFVGAPDTGMNTAQTIYFIGLIILLCGVGIVYANAKPVESK